MAVIGNAGFSTKKILIIVFAACLVVIGGLAAYNYLDFGNEEEDIDIIPTLPTEQQTIARYLTQNTWRAADGSMQISFDKDGTGAELASGGDEASFEWSMTDIDLQSENDSEVPYVQAIMYFDDEPHVFGIEAPSASDEEKMTDAGIISNAIFTSSYYEDTRFWRMPKEQFKIYEFDTSKFTEVLNDPQALANDLKTFCEENVPLSTSLTWTGEVETNYTNGNIVTYFDCDDSLSTTVEVNFDLQDKTYSISQYSG